MSDCLEADLKHQVNVCTSESKYNIEKGSNQKYEETNAGTYFTLQLLAIFVEELHLVPNVSLPFLAVIKLPLQLLNFQFLTALASYNF